MNKPMSIEQLVSEIKDVSNGYQPNRSVTEQLSGVVMVPVVGPTGVGKTSAIYFVAEHFYDFGVVKKFTSREERPNDTPGDFEFYDHDVAGLTEILDRAKNGEFANITVNPANSKVYGTLAEGYNKKFSMLETLSNAVADFKELPFKDVRPLGLVCSPNFWLPRFTERYGHSDTGRLSEAQTSLEWLLEQGPDFPWVVNDGTLQKAAETIVDLVANQTPTNPVNRQVGEKLLDLVKRLQ